MLFCSGHVPSASSLARQLVFTDILTQPQTREHQQYLLSFLEDCPLLVRQQFVARATSSLDIDGTITVSISDSVSKVMFLPDNRLVSELP